MKVPFNAPGRILADHEDELMEAVRAVVRSGYYILGPAVSMFEGGLDSYFGRTAVSCNSGTDAIILGLKVLGVGPGDEVITVSHTAIPTITAIRSTGARPVFADIDPATWLMDCASVRALVTEQTKAIVPVHLYGNAVSVEALPEGIPVLEDVAQAFGARRADRLAGTIGSFGALSFYPTKNIGALGDGGALLVETPQHAERARMLRNYGQRDRYNASLEGGINSRLDEIQAAILSVRLKRVDSWNAERTRMVGRYREALAGLPLKFQQVAPGSTPAWHLAVVALESEDIRDRLRAHLDRAGVQTLIHYPTPTHEQEAFAPHRRRTLPHTESLARRIVSLPLYVGLTEAELEAVVVAIRAFFG